MDISTVTVLDHPLVKLFTMELRNRNKRPSEVRALLRQICSLMVPELTAELGIIPVSDPDYPEGGWRLATPVSVIGVMRTGLVLMEEFLEIFPDVQAVHLGIRPARDGMGVLPYYESIPTNFEGRDIIILDAALSSGNTLLYALETVTPYNPNSVTIGVVVADPGGITRIQDRFPNVRFVVAMTDQTHGKPLLPQDKFGVFADRVYGTAE